LRSGWVSAITGCWHIDSTASAQQMFFISVIRLMKPLFILITVLCPVISFAQKDSLRKGRLSGFQLELGSPVHPAMKALSQSDYRRYVTGDPLLDADLQNYHGQPWYFFSVYEGLPALKLYFDLKKGRLWKQELFIGLRYGQEANAGSYHTLQSADTLGVYTDAVTGHKLYEMHRMDESYSYGIRAQSLMLPLGINFSTNQRNLFWFTAGLEIAPALKFGYVFTSRYQVSSSRVIVAEGDSLNSRNNYLQDVFSRSKTRSTQRTTRLNGMGGGVYVSLPFTAYFHPFRKRTVLKHLHLLVSVSPVYVFSYNQYTGQSSALAFSTAAGLRCNW
jgi:hypothetical protein